MDPNTASVVPTPSLRTDLPAVLAQASLNLGL